MEERFRLTRREFLQAALAFVVSCKLQGDEPKTRLELPGIADLNFPLSGDMYLLAGPHYLVNNEGPRYTIDVYSPDRDAKIVAAKYGKVIVADEFMADGNINKTLHSIVEIDVGDGYTLEYLHVGKVRVRVKNCPPWRYSWRTIYGSSCTLQRCRWKINSTFYRSYIPTLGLKDTENRSKLTVLALGPNYKTRRKAGRRNSEQRR